MLNRNAGTYQRLNKELKQLSDCIQYLTASSNAIEVLRTRVGSIGASDLLSGQKYLVESIMYFKEVEKKLKDNIRQLRQVEELGESDE